MMQTQFNHSLLLLARQYREMSQADVAGRAGLNQGHYSRIENGLLPGGPSEDNVRRIADVLFFPESFFFQADPLAGLPLSVHPMHRKKESVGERALKKIHAELNLRLLHLRKMLSAVDVDAVLPLPWIDVDEGGGPREIAQKIRTAWMLPQGPISNLTDCVERAGVLVIVSNFDAPIDGVTMRLPDLPPCIFLNGRSPADRTRFSLAHELGHVVMHRIPTDSIEDEANTFAAELLVPEKELRRDLIGGRVTLERLARLKAKWRVSMQFLLFQAKETGCVSPNQAQYLWKQISRLGWRTREPVETEFPHEKPVLFPQMLSLHTDELGYGLLELSELLRSDQNDIRHLYGLQADVRDRRHLHLVR